MSETSDPEKPRVLIVDDERFNINALHSLLKDEFRTLAATSGEQALEAALSRPPDLILLDVNMPGMDGYEVCRRLKADQATRAIPIIFVTALSDAEDEARGLGLGAEDYIAKPFSPAVVRARVRTQMRLKRQSDLLERLAFVDGLTGLSNRRAFDDRSRREWSRCERAGTPIALMMMDVDHFKLYNDRYGHAAGDECLRAVAQALDRQIQRAGDFVARYGGEEFVVVLPNVEAAAAQVVAERLRAAVTELGIEHLASKAAAQVTISVGVATAQPRPAIDLAAALAVADQMLYACKAAGRNCVRMSVLD